MNFDLELLGLLLSVIGNLAGVSAWYSTSLKKRFASEAEWKKVIDTQTDILEEINNLFEELNNHEDRVDKKLSAEVRQIFCELIELKAAINTLSMMSSKNKQDKV